MISFDSTCARPLATGALLASALLALIGVATPAHAASSPPQNSPQGRIVTADGLETLRADLARAGYPRTTSTVDGIDVDTYTVRPGTSVNVPRTASGANVRLGVGLDGFRPWVTLNRTDQGAIKNGGSAAIGVTICALSGGNVIICGGVAVALAVAFTYIDAHNICPTSKPQLKLYVAGNSAAQCVK